MPVLHVGYHANIFFVEESPASQTHRVRSAFQRWDNCLVAQAFETIQMAAAPQLVCDLTPKIAGGGLSSSLEGQASAVQTGFVREPGVNDFGRGGEEPRPSAGDRAAADLAAGGVWGFGRAHGASHAADERVRYGGAGTRQVSHHGTTSTCVLRVLCTLLVCLCACVLVLVRKK